jgi:beta-lactamase superfamily II metal-dependent hydrolase
VDMLILPAYDKTRVDNANSLLNSVNAAKIYIPGAYRSDENPAATCVGRPLVLNWQGMKLTLFPDKTGTNMIAAVACNGTSAILTGGVDADLTKYNVEATSIHADMIIFGADITNDFAKAVSPQIAVEGSSYAAYAGATFESLGCKVRDTDESGRVSILTRGGGEYMLAGSSN